MKTKFFKRLGIFFIPVHILGWILALMALAYCVYLFIDIDSQSHSVSDTLINFFFNTIIVGAVYSLIAFFTSRKEKEE